MPRGRGQDMSCIYDLVVSDLTHNYIFIRGIIHMMQKKQIFWIVVDCLKMGLNLGYIFKEREKKKTVFL